ncbi:MAG TPA: DUF4932 domain-containing protein [Flavipsychrobacter sp.]|nr:DUF4932 domain-containing protein [Flavipsychrobacter sp.]
MRAAVTITMLFFTLCVKARSPKVNVVVDERMELLTTIQYLSGYPILTQADLRYKKEIDEYFRDYRDHPAVVLYRNVYERFLAFDAAPTYLYHFSFPGFRQQADFSENDLRTFEFDKHADTLAMLMANFKDFYKRADFHKFYEAHEGFYDSLIAPIEKKIEESRVVDALEEHYGKENKEYNVVLAPLLHDGGYGPMVQKGSGLAMYAIIGPKGDSKSLPEFDIKNLLSEYVIHEFSHSFCNPLIAANLQELQKDSCLLRPIKESQEEQGYGSWEACLYEHWVRANEIVLTEKIFSRQRASDLADEMVREGKWIYLDGLIAIVRDYKTKREQYKSIDEVMPQVVDYFHGLRKTCKQ